VEIARFKECYGLRDDQTIARELNRSVSSVRKMAETIFGGNRKTGSWDGEEIDQLKRYLGATSVKKMALILGRRPEDVERQLKELRKSTRSGRWSQDEIAELKRLYGTRTDESLALILGRDVQSIKSTSRRLCISKDKAFLRRHDRAGKSTRMPRWKKDELQLLRERYPAHSNLSIAQDLNRSVKSVVSKAHNLGLKKDPARLREMGRENVSLRYKKP